MKLKYCCQSGTLSPNSWVSTARSALIASGLEAERPVTCMMMLSTGLSGDRCAMKKAIEQPKKMTAMSWMKRLRAKSR